MFVQQKARKIIMDAVYHWLTYSKPITYNELMLKLVYKKSASKGLAKMPKKQKLKMIEALNKIAYDPDAYQGDWKQLKNSDFLRLRIGSYRAICQIQNEQIILLVLKVGSRGDIYK